VEEFKAEAGAVYQRNLRLEVRRIRSGAFRDRHGNVVWLDFAGPYKHIVEIEILLK
jgi:hypothetical protein